MLFLLVIAYQPVTTSAVATCGWLDIKGMFVSCIILIDSEGKQVLLYYFAEDIEFDSEPPQSTVEELCILFKLGWHIQGGSKN